MACLAWWVDERLRTPFSTWAWVQPQDQSVAWPESTSPDLKEAMRLDIRDGTVSRVPHKSIPLAYLQTSSGWRLRQTWGVGGLTSGCDAWRAESLDDPHTFNLPNCESQMAVVAGNSLAYLGENLVMASDVERAIAGDAPLSVALPGNNVSIGEQPKAIPGTNRFLVECQGLNPPQVKLFEVDKDHLREIAGWTVGGARAFAVMIDGQINTLSADSKSLERRNPSDGTLEDSAQVNASLAASWHAEYITGNHLTFLDPKTIAYHTVRLSDLAPIPALSELVPVEVRSGQYADRYLLYGENRRAYKHRVVVYDTQAEKIAFDRYSNEMYFDAAICDPHRLVTISNELGLTCTIVDLPSGKTLAVHRPFLWPLVACVTLLALWMLWIKAWLNSAGHLGVLVNFLVLMLVTMVPAATRMASYSLRDFTSAEMLFFSSVLAIVYWATVYMIAGQRRPLVRVSVWIMSMVFCLVAFNTARMFVPKLDPVVQTMECFIILLTSLVSLPVLLIARRWLARRLVITQPVSQPSGKRSSLLEMFGLTSASACLMVVLLPKFSNTAVPVGQAVTTIIMCAALSATLALLATCTTLSSQGPLARLGYPLILLSAIVLVADTSVLNQDLSALGILFRIARIFSWVFITVAAYGIAVQRHAK